MLLRNLLLLQQTNSELYIFVFYAIKCFPVCFLTHLSNNHVRKIGLFPFYRGRERGLMGRPCGFPKILQPGNGEIRTSFSNHNFLPHILLFGD